MAGPAHIFVDRSTAEEDQPICGRRSCLDGMGGWARRSKVRAKDIVLAERPCHARHVASARHRQPTLPRRYSRQPTTCCACMDRGWIESLYGRSRKWTIAGPRHFWRSSTFVGRHTMSAIAGIVRFDDGPVKKRELERVAAALKQFGPDRSGIAIDHRVGFAHSLMRMTPEDSFDRQPLSLNGGIMLVADLRIDNRDEIIRRFTLDCHEARDWSDSRLLMGAWEMAGDDVWRHIRGPFAAAIWDPRRRSLTLARDHLGLNVVMWFKTERFFAFSSMPGGLFAFDAIPRAICEEKFADFMVLNHAEHATTIYKDIYRVPPGHVLQVAHDGDVRCREYWSIAQVPEIRLGSDEDYAEGLRDRLDMAVRRQMRSAHPVGSLLSGGLDSSSVTMLAARALHAKN